jgi:hypothetical protein
VDGRSRGWVVYGAAKEPVLGIVYVRPWGEGRNHWWCFDRVRNRYINANIVIYLPNISNNSAMPLKLSVS